MRILHAVNVRWFNATAWYGLYLARLQQRAGHQVLVLVQPGTETARKARDMGLDVLGLDLNTSNPLKVPLLAARMARLLKVFQPHVVNCHRGESFYLFGLLRRMGYGFRLVRTRGDQRLPRNNGPNRFLHGTVADAVIATNSRMAGHLHGALGVPSERLHRILGGVDTGAFHFDPAGRERVRAEFGWGPETPVIGLLGRLDRVKGQKECLQALAAMRQDPRFADARLCLVAHESAMTENQVMAWAREAGVSEATVVTGKRPDVAECISAMDVGVVASLWSEAIARAALEIMACDRPLVGTDVGVMPDLLPERALVPAGDADALAALLSRALGDEIFARGLRADHARRMPQLSGEAFLLQTMAVYGNLVGEPDA